MVVNATNVNFPLGKTNVQYFFTSNYAKLVISIHLYQKHKEPIGNTCWSCKLSGPWDMTTIVL